MSEKLTNSDIRRIMVGHKSGQRMLPEYLPPEAQGGKGADNHTELMGFQKDFDVVIARTLAQFENGAERNAFAEFLTKEAISQGGTSAGPYLRATLLEVRDVVAPDYLKNIAAKTVTPMDAATAIKALRDGNADRDAWNILDDVEKQLPKNATANDVTALLRKAGDDHGAAGDDWMAETADILRGSISAASDKHAAVQIQAKVTELKSAEMPHRPAAPSR
jgi:hypothetical protein